LPRFAQLKGTVSQKQSNTKSGQGSATKKNPKKSEATVKSTPARQKVI